MVGRITVVAIGAAGVVVAALSVASATLWRPDDVLRATVTTDSPYVVTAPGVVEMGGQPTSVTVTAPDRAPVVVAVGRDTDVVGWVGGDPHETVSGMTGWTSLRILAPTAGPTGEPAGDSPAEDEPEQEGPAEYQSPAGSDMWVAEASGKGRAELKSWAPGRQYPGRWSVLVANPTGAEATVELAWPRKVSTPWLIPGLVLGLGAVGWAAYQELRRREMLAFVPWGRAGKTSDADDDTGTRSATGPGAKEPGNAAAPSPPRSRREVRAAQEESRSGPVPAVDAAPVPEPAVDDVSPVWGTAAALATPFDGGDVPAPAQEPVQRSRPERALPSWSPARSWQRARHSTEPDAPPPTTGAPPTRSRPTEATPVVAPPGRGPIQPPPASPGRPRTPAWSRGAAPSPSGAAPVPAQPPAPAPAPAQQGSSWRSRTWPPGSAPSAGSSQGAGHDALVETGPSRRSPFGRGGARPAPAPSSSSAPTLGASQSARPAPLSGWMPGRGGRTGAVPQVPAPPEQTDGRRPAWLGRTRSPSPSPSPSTGPVPAAPAPGTAPRLSSGPQSDPAPRGAAWRQIWGIPPGDGQEEDR